MKTLKLDFRHFVILLYFAFILSGFSALIYETVWVRYLRLFLGNASVGQVLIIVLWMGGLALGSWIGSRYQDKSKNLILAYAIIELSVGVFAFLFHSSFEILDQIGSGLLQYSENQFFITIGKLFLSSILVIIPMILMGMTFPLASSFVVQQDQAKNGRRISMLYFANSLGGAFGAITGGFVLLTVFGLQGTVVIAGMINILVGFIFLIINKMFLKSEWTGIGHSSQVVIKSYEKIHWIGLVVFLTGLSMFVFEITWIRMFNLLLGSMFYTFEIVLSVLILGIATGSFIFSRFADRVVDFSKPILIIIYSMVVCGIVSIVFYSSGFDWLQVIYPWLTASKNGFINFVVVSFIFTLLIIFPMAFFSGGLFPLLLVHVFRKTGNRKHFGQLYALNTLGAMAGSVTALAFFPILGITKVFISGVFILFISAIIVHSFGFRSGRPVYAFSLFIFAGLLIFLIFFRIEDKKLSSGVFRYGLVDEHTTSLFYKDGITSSVALYETQSGRRVLTINGKPDASLGKGDKISGDETTQVLLAALPFSFGECFKDVAVIGLGSGKTAHVALGFPEVEHLDIIEIEPEVINAARILGKDVDRVFTDKRSNIIVTDARSFFKSGRRSYDLIISEPSNPWVSGVGGLFSTEFYADSKKNLNPGGLFVQWIHLYELDIQLFASIIKAVSSQFNHFSLFFLDNSNLGLIASESPVSTFIYRSIFEEPMISSDLDKIGLKSDDDLRMRFIGSEIWLAPWFNSYDVPANSDFFPFLELNGPKVRFQRKNVNEFAELSQFYIPMNEIFEEYPSDKMFNIPGKNYLFDFPERKQQAFMIWQSMDDLQNFSIDHGNRHLIEKIRTVKSLVSDSNWMNQSEIPVDQLIKIDETALYTLPYLPKAEASVIWDKVAHSIFYRKLDGFHKQKVDLYLFTAQRDYKAIMELTAIMLSERPTFNADCYDYVPYLYAVSAFKTGHVGEAVSCLKKYRSTEECFIHRLLMSNFEYRLLKSND